MTREKGTGWAKEPKRKEEMAGTRGRPLANFEDRIEREVRRRLSDLLASAGMGYSRIGVEILYLLPESFTREYSKLYDQAFGDASGTGSSLSSYGGDDGKLIAKAGNGRGKGEQGALDEKGEAGGLSTRSMYRSGQVGGKRYSRAALVIRDELALDTKTRIDRRIQQVIREELKQLAEDREEARIQVSQDTEGGS